MFVLLGAFFKLQKFAKDVEDKLRLNREALAQTSPTTVAFSHFLLCKSFPFFVHNQVLFEQNGNLLKRGIFMMAFMYRLVQYVHCYSSCRNIMGQILGKINFSWACTCHKNLPRPYDFLLNFQYKIYSSKNSK